MAYAVSLLYARPPRLRRRAAGRFMAGACFARTPLLRSPLGLRPPHRLVPPAAAPGVFCRLARCATRQPGGLSPGPPHRAPSARGGSPPPARAWVAFHRCQVPSSLVPPLWGRRSVGRGRCRGSRPGSPAPSSARGGAPAPSPRPPLPLVAPSACASGFGRYAPSGERCPAFGGALCRASRCWRFALHAPRRMRGVCHHRPRPASVSPRLAVPLRGTFIARL